MNYKRMLKYYFKNSTKRTELGFIFLTVTVVFVFFVLSRNLPDDGTTFICESDNNILIKKLNKTCVNVIPSVPERYYWFENVDKNKSADEQQFNPKEHQCVDMRTPGVKGTLLICIYDPLKDQVISAHLKDKGIWEADNIDALYTAYRMFPGLVLVDLGCNIGAFSLPAAKMGMEVIAVDSMINSLKLLQRSLFINGLTCHVTLVHNAIHRKRMQMRVAYNPTNIGGSKVVEILEFRRKKLNPSNFIDAICLDDLVPLVKGKTVFLKMDLEGAERAVLECASQFFQQVNVKVLLIEWTNYKHNEEDSGFIKSFLDIHHMIPTWGVDRDRYIDPMASHSWPENVFWMKKD